MAVSSSDLTRSDDVKGKAVLILHTWKDHLWELGAGRKADPPEPRDSTMESEESTDTTEGDHLNDAEGQTAESSAKPLDTEQDGGSGEVDGSSKDPTPTNPTLTPEGKDVLCA